MFLSSSAGSVFFFFKDFVLHFFHYQVHYTASSSALLTFTGTQFDLVSSVMSGSCAEN